jgi:hypothetical protein
MDEISEQEEQIVREAKGKLLEHFDSVRIFVTRHGGPKSQTSYFDSGGGNFLAQLGQVRMWLMMQEENIKGSVPSKNKNPQ